MKTKKYAFTEDEVMTLRNALLEYHQMIKHLKPESPIFIRSQRNAESLKDQFMQDYSLWGKTGMTQRSSTKQSPAKK